MAKKKSNNTNLLWSLITLILGGAILGFLALPYLKSSATFAGSTTTSTVSGYELINFSDGYETGVAVVLLLLTIFASLLIFASILKLLADLKVVKDATFKKVANLSFVLSALAVAVLVITSIIIVPVSYTGNDLSFGSSSVKWGAGWAALVINTLVGCGVFITSVLATRK